MHVKLSLGKFSLEQKTIQINIAEIVNGLIQYSIYFWGFYEKKNG